MKAKTLVERLERFKETWLSNAGAQLEFVKLIAETHQYPRSDHADKPLLDWIDDERMLLRSIGIK